MTTRTNLAVLGPRGQIFPCPVIVHAEVLCALFLGKIEQQLPGLTVPLREIPIYVARGQHVGGFAAHRLRSPSRCHFKGLT